MTGIRKWLDNRVSEHLAVQGIELSPDEYELLMDKVDLWLFENIDVIIGDMIKEL
jgi:hypothetical protein